MKKKTFYEEVAYVVGLLMLALGTALTEFGGFGISMVVAPAYILHLKVSTILPFFSFGMAEYVLQATILLVMMLLLRKVKVAYFLSFLTAVLYGFALDGAISLVSILPENGIIIKVVAYVAGVIICAAAIALLFHTYLPPEVYEMFVKEVSSKLQIKLSTFKIMYDCGSLLIAVVLSFVLFKAIVGIGVGTIVCAFLNGMLIACFSNIYERVWEFRARFNFPIVNQKERN